jgi:hypothetical protein
LVEGFFAGFYPCNAELDFFFLPPILGTKYAEAPTYSRGESQELLVGGAITVLKNMSSSIGRINYPIYEMENNPNV